jgi:hypothetical protein
VSTGPPDDPRQAAASGLFLLGDRWCLLRLADSVTEAVDDGAGQVLVTGSHGGLSAGRFALQARPALAVFNDAGVGLDGAGIAGLPLLEAAGIAACAVAHDSARIGEAASTRASGVVSHANLQARALGLLPGTALAAWLSGCEAESSPDRR